MPTYFLQTRRILYQDRKYILMIEYRTSPNFEAVFGSSKSVADTVMTVWSGLVFSGTVALKMYIRK